MEYGGAEATIDSVAGAATVDESLQYRAILHFDLKAGNIFLAERDENHKETPVAKVGDFGGSYPVTASGTKDYSKRMEMRRVLGTSRFYAPEQFSNR
ncbi:uncharacterized protein LY89DRAFT_741672 [Mollisia scopiformis]|uniref:Protein kinase domain-containing protein n=1 Tax=Mollisia scopiformis TaxID=149040 RepID=A0A132BAF1_MOLSC|nr:uncharacterized protein LY89DRAFT_741672 [Mollisia scopiformis]KUJ08834.1 hypothetical protein LY89DRAFT_741672 [Mollisia scopiformis]